MKSHIKVTIIHIVKRLNQFANIRTELNFYSVNKLNLIKVDYIFAQEATICIETLSPNSNFIEMLAQFEIGKLLAIFSVKQQFNG